MHIDPKLEKDFNLSSEDLKIMQLLKEEAEEISIPLALDPNILKQRLPSENKKPLWKVLSPIMAAAAACFAVMVVGSDTFFKEPDLKISLESVAPGIISEISPDDIFMGKTEIEVSDNFKNNETVKSQIEYQDREISDEPYKEESDAPVLEEQSSVPAEYREVYNKVIELKAKNPAQVKGVARANNFSAVFGENSSFISTRQTDMESKFDTAQFDGKYIYGISEDVKIGYQTVVISKVDSGEFSPVAKLYVDFGMDNDSKFSFSNIRLLSCYVDQSRLLVVGSANYGENDSNIVTAIATYDVSNPENPVLLANSYQDGNLISSRISGGFAYFITRKTVSGPSESNQYSYLPFNMANNRYNAIEDEDIHLSEYAQTPCYIVASSILLKEPYDFYDTKAILADSSDFYIDESSIYFTENIYKDAKLYTSVVRMDFGKGNFDFIGENVVSGRLFDSESIQTYENVLALITMNQNEYTLYTLTDNLYEVNAVKDITAGQKLNSVHFDEENVYLSIKDKVIAFDIMADGTVVRNNISDISETLVNVIPVGKEEAVEIKADEKNTVLSLVLYDVISQRRVREISNVVVVQGDIYSEVLDNPKAMLINKEKGFVGFSYYNYNGENGCYYALYKVDKDGITKKVEYRYPAKTYDQKAFIKGNVLYVTGSSSLAAVNIDTGKTLWEFNF